MYQYYTADDIFTGDAWLTNHVIVVANGLIEDVLPRHTLSTDIYLEDFGQSMIAPAFIDVQVYGAGKKLFAQYPHTETLELMRDEFEKSGTVVFLPTVATNPPELLKKCIDAVRIFRKTDTQSIPGLHLEGPWFNAKKKGAHLEAWIHAPEMEEVKNLLEYGKGVIKMITLAPEVCAPGIIELIRSYDVIVSAGHSDATYQESIEGFSSGISAVTHLYNAMSPLQHREPGLVGAAMKHEEVMVSIIPDGYHVAYEAISIAKSVIGSRLFAITDAVTETNEGPYKHQLAGEKYECNGVLSGSALTMFQAFKNLTQKTGISIEESLRMCSLYPARVLGCNNQYGKIAPRFAGQFLIISKQLELVRVIIST